MHVSIVFPGHVSRDFEDITIEVDPSSHIRVNLDPFNAKWRFLWLVAIYVSWNNIPYANKQANKSPSPALKGLTR